MNKRFLVFLQNRSQKNFNASNLGLKVDIIKLDFPPGYPGIRVFLGSTPGNSNLSIPVQP